MGTRALDGVPRDDRGPSSARGAEAGQDRNRRIPGGTGARRDGRRLSDGGTGETYGSKAPALIEGASQRQRLAFCLWELADLIQADERRRSFRSRAYRRAIWSLDELSPALDDPTDEMLSVPGVGPGIVRLIEAFRDQGAIPELDELRRRYPREASRIRRLPRMTPTIQRALKSEAGVETVSDLLRSIEAGDAVGIKGVGDATVDLWVGALALWPPAPAIPAHEASVLAATFADHISSRLETEVLVAGEVRRVTEWVDRLAVVVVSETVAPVRDFLRTSAAGVLVDGNGREMSLITPPGPPLDVRVAGRTGLGTAMVAATGPCGHLEGLDLRHDLPSEEDVYASHGRRWVPPAARERSTEPPEDLIGTGMIRGDLHVHSAASPDGRMSIDTIVIGMVSMGYEYAAVTDHTLGLRLGGLDAAGLRRQVADIAAARERHPGFKLLHGAEINIGVDGDLDIDDETLDSLDVVVAGVHSRFDLPIDEQTDRVVAAIRHPAVGVLAHPTGRRIGLRPALSLDIDRVIEAALESRVALEANGHRDRLDVSSALASAAAARGVMLVTNSDAHRPGELANVGNAVATLQRAGVRQSQVLNAMTWPDLEAWLVRQGPR